MQSSLPFEINKSESFFDVLGDWIGDVFYDTLPESGFELRDEQIYMAFQLEKAFKERKGDVCRGWCWNRKNDCLPFICHLLCALYQSPCNHCMCR